MSHRMTDPAWATRGISGSEKLVLVNLADRHNERTGRCDPSFDLIAEETCLGRRTVVRVIASLIEKGLISRPKDSQRKRASYSLHLTAKRNQRESESGATMTPDSDPPSGATVTKSGATVTKSGATVTKSGATMAPEPEEPEKEPEDNRTHTPTPQAGSVCEEADLLELSGEEEGNGRTTPADFQAAWNDLPDPFKKIREMDSQRCAMLRSRLKDKFWRENWREALDIMSRSDFHRGGGEKGWIATPKYFLRPGIVNELVEAGNTQPKKRDARELHTAVGQFGF